MRVGPSEPQNATVRCIVEPEVVRTTNEQVLVESVRAWVDHLLPEDRGVAERAAAVALNWYRDGSTVSEACHQAGAYVTSWMGHPAHSIEPDPVVLRLVL
jgi:hypothetical protein